MNDQDNRRPSGVTTAQEDSAGAHPKDLAHRDNDSPRTSEGRIPAQGSRTSTRPAPSQNRSRFSAPDQATRILMVEDDRPLADALSAMLEDAGFIVYTTNLGEEAIDLVRAWAFHLVLLDLALPDMAGQTVLHKIRQTRPETPIIIISGDDDVDARIAGLLDGADDFITRPFHNNELMARIHAILRRARVSTPTEIEMGPLHIDLSAHRATVHGQVVPLTGKEYACLEYLAVKRGTTVTKEMFLAHLYGGRNEPEMKIIDVFICKMRRKLADASAPDVIETIWGRGYTIPNMPEKG